MAESIFIEHEKWSHYSHPNAQLQQLAANDAPAIRLYFTQRALTSSQLRQLTDTQLHKADAHLRSHKVKAIFKERMKQLRRRTQVSDRMELNAKLSSRTNVCEEEEVSQYLSIWEEPVLLA
jgi:hypothetical protein